MGEGEQHTPRNIYIYIYIYIVVLLRKQFFFFISSTILALKYRKVFRLIKQTRFICWSVNTSCSGGSNGTWCSRLRNSQHLHVTQLSALALAFSQVSVGQFLCIFSFVNKVIPSSRLNSPNSFLSFFLYFFLLCKNQ